MQSVASVHNSMTCVKTIAQILNQGIHAEEKLLECKKCKQVFNRIGNLKRHEANHCREQPYVCEVCNKTFKQMRDLTRHEVIHTGDKPYVCIVCTQAFSYLASLKRHERIHTGEKPYVCKMCSRAFSRVCHLKSHEMIHSGEKPYICKICTKAFCRKSALTVHERIHTGERPYDCLICGDAFNQLSHLNEHKKIHMGELSYICYVCTEAFSERRDLLSHQRMHSKEEQEKGEISKKSSPEVDLVNIFIKETTVGVSPARRIKEERPENSPFTVISHQRMHSIEEQEKGDISKKLSSEVDIENVFIKEKPVDVSAARMIKEERPENGPFSVRPFGCGFCGEMFDEENHFRVHCSNHSGESEFSSDLIFHFPCLGTLFDEVSKEEI